MWKNKNGANSDHITVNYFNFGIPSDLLLLDEVGLIQCPWKQYHIGIYGTFSSLLWTTTISAALLISFDPEEWEEDTLLEVIPDVEHLKFTCK